MSSRNRLARYLTTAALSRIATESSGPALLLVSIAILGPGPQGPFLAGSLTGAAAIAGPIVGVLLDRAARPRLGFTAAMVGFAAGLALLGALIGRIDLIVLVPLAVLTGVAYPALTGGWTAQVPGLVPAHALPRAYAADAGTYNVASIIGAPLASALLLLSDRAPLWLPALALAVALAVLRSVPLRAHPHQAPTSLAAGLRRGAATIVHRPRLRRAFILTTVPFMGQAAIFVTAPVIVQQLTGELALTGVLLGAIALGGLAATAVILRWPIRRPDRVIVAATVTAGLTLGAAGLAPTLPLAVAAALGLGASLAPQMSATFLVRNRESSPEVRAQVFTTAASLRTTAFAAGSILFGLLLPAGVPVVTGVGVGLYAVGLVLGLLAGPAPQWRRR